MNAKELLNQKNRNVHIIGIGGVGMSALAMLLKKLGHTVSGSDLVESKYLKMLSQQGVETWRGSYPENINKNSIVFYSTAVGEHDPERVAAVEHQMPIFSRHFLIEYITEKFFTIAITGTHGKTTSSAWAAVLLENAGLDPCALVGGFVPQWQGNFRLGNGSWLGKPILIMEADESDKSFLYIDVDVAIITNIDMDHPDHYQDLKELEKHFWEFIVSLNKNNSIFLPSYEFLQHPMYQTAKNDFSHLTTNFDNFAENFQIVNANTRERSINYKNYFFKVGLAGLHNLKNASIIFALAEFFNIETQVLRQTLEKFSGVERRLQVLTSYRINDKKVYLLDDYAHHPSEVESGLRTLQEQYDQVVVVWEPHRFSRFTFFDSQFFSILKNFSQTGKVFMLPIYSAGEKEQHYSHYKDVENKFLDHFQKLDIQDCKNLLSFLEKEASANNIAVVFMGAGLSSKQAKKCQEEFSKHYEQT